MVPPKGIGIVETKHVTFTPPGGFELECGEKLETVTLAYETYGRLNAERTNAVLVLHALSGTAHAAGYHKGAKKPGWWDEMIGPGRAFDTEKYFVICSNVLGGCKGSTGPSSINPKTQRPYGLDFPLISVGDMVNCQALLVDHFGIDRLLSVAGGSMGGMQVIGWLVNHPHRLRSAIPISTAIRHSPQQIAFNEVGRQAIMADPALEVRQLLRGGRYRGRGLSVARMVGHITYMSDTSMTRKFGRHRKQDLQPLKFTPANEVEDTCNITAKICQKIDAHSYLYITKAIDDFDPAGKGPWAIFCGASTSSSW